MGLRQRYSQPFTVVNNERGKRKGQWLRRIGSRGLVWLFQCHNRARRLTLDYSERSALTVLIRAARAAGTNDAKIAEATMTAADPINGSSPGSWSAGT